MKSWLWYKYWVSIETKYLGPKFCKDLCVTLPVRPKYMVNWFHKCYENLITDSYLNSKIILFSASVRTFEHCSAWTEQKVSFVSLQLFRNSLTVLRSSSAFFFGVFVLLLFGKWIYMVLAYHNKSCNYSIFQKNKKTQVHSTKYKKAGIVTFLLHITTGVTYEKYATWFLDLVVRLILHWW